MNDDLWDNDKDPSETTFKEHILKNEGYLAGLTEKKSTSVQIGFDESYQEGAAVGVRVGRLVGILQGLRRHSLLLELRADLSKNRLFQDGESRSRECIESWERKVTEILAGPTP